MKVLITGGTGLLGRALIEKANGKSEILATYVGNYEIENAKQVKYRKLDIRDKEKHQLLFQEFKPDVVIHTAGIGNPDYAERYQKESSEVNIDGTQNIIDNCERSGAKFIYISSNAIYDGESAPYREEDRASPVNYYGRIKLEGEAITRKAKVAWAIVRPILMYGWNHAFERPNVVATGISRLRKKEEFFVYDDVYYTPLYYYSCAEAIWAIIEKDKFDIFNIGGKERLSIYELMQEASRVFGLDEGLLKPVQQGFFQDLVKRPRDTSYDTAKMERVLGIKALGVREGLELMRSEEAKLHA